MNIRATYRMRCPGVYCLSNLILVDGTIETWSEVLGFKAL